MQAIHSLEFLVLCIFCFRRSLLWVLMMRIYNSKSKIPGLDPKPPPPPKKKGPKRSSDLIDCIF
jgi:hypothetical protein